MANLDDRARTGLDHVEDEEDLDRLDAVVRITVEASDRRPPPLGRPYVNSDSVVDREGRRLVVQPCAAALRQVPVRQAPLADPDLIATHVIERDIEGFDLERACSVSHPEYA
jgi:hypothetical protein